MTVGKEVFVTELLIENQPCRHVLGVALAFPKDAAVQALTGRAIGQGFVHEPLALAVYHEGVRQGTVGNDEAFLVLNHDGLEPFGARQLDDRRPDGVSHVVDGRAMFHAQFDAVARVAFHTHGPSAGDGVALVLLPHRFVAFKAATSQDDAVGRVDLVPGAVVFQHDAGHALLPFAFLARIAALGEEVDQGVLQFHFHSLTQDGVHNGSGQARAHSERALAFGKVFQVAPQQFHASHPGAQVGHGQQQIGRIIGVHIHRRHRTEVRFDVRFLPRPQQAGIESARFDAAPGFGRARGVQPIVGVAFHPPKLQVGARSGEEVHALLAFLQEGVNHFVAGAVPHRCFHVLAAQVSGIRASESGENVVSGYPHHAGGFGGRTSPLVAFFDHQYFQTTPRGGQRSGQAGSSGTNDDDVIGIFAGTAKGFTS